MSARRAIREARAGRGEDFRTEEINGDGLLRAGLVLQHNTENLAAAGWIRSARDLAESILHGALLDVVADRRGSAKFAVNNT